MDTADRDKLVDHPTFLEHIRCFFDQIDIDHMRDEGFDLATYDGVREKAAQILAQTKSGNMPPEPERRWPGNRVKTFRNWITDKFPMGVSRARPPKTSKAFARAAAPMRRNSAKLSEAEIDKLALAFKTIMDREPTHPQSYFALADIHWLPTPVNCLHHEMRYNPWHRVYIDRFEAALRSVPGCEAITLPYWDILTEPPKWLFRPPFASYTLPVAVGPDYPAGHKTARHTAKTIVRNLADRNVPKTIRDALAAPKFAAFTSLIESAHDDGHVSCGPAMERTDIAAFDPLFWFFHCNWERLWWAWQERHTANTLARFRQTLDPDDMDWLDLPPLNELPPFTETADQTIDNSGYSYEESGEALFRSAATVESGNIRADRMFRLQKRARLSVRVKDIARLRIRGSFDVHLLADGETVARRAFFQGTEPEICPNCAKHPNVSVDFRVDRSTVVGKSLEIRIEVLGRKDGDRWVDLTEIGSPTINVRELLTAE